LGGADTGKLAVEEILVGSVFLGRQVTRELVAEAADHPGDRALREFHAVGVWLYIVLLDVGEDLIQHAVIDIRLRWRVEQQPPGPVGGIASPLELGEAARIEGPNGDDEQDGDALQPGHEWIIAGYGRRPWEGSRL